MSQAVMDDPEFSGSSIAEIVEAYREAGNPWPAPHIEIAAWAVNNDLIDVPFEDRVKYADRLIAEKLKRIECTALTGTRCRKYVTARGAWMEEGGKTTQRWLWADALECETEFAHAAIRSMRTGISKDCKALARQVRTMNECNPNLKEVPIQLNLDFSEEAE